MEQVSRAVEIFDGCNIPSQRSYEAEIEEAFFVAEFSPLLHKPITLAVFRPAW